MSGILIVVTTFACTIVLAFILISCNQVWDNHLNIQKLKKQNKRRKK